MIDMKDYCDGETWRTLREPFVRDGHKYATDGVICIRIPCDEPNTESSVGMRVPDVKKMWPVDFDSSDWFVPFTVKPCEFCNHDNKKIVDDCQECDGTGTCDMCACGHDHECGCCNGTGKDESWCQCKVEILPGVSLRGRQYGLVMRLPGVMVSASGKKDETLAFPLRIKFDGGEGLVMTLGVP